MTQRYSPLLVMALGNLLIGIGAGMIAYAETVFGYCGAMFVFTVGEMVGMPVALAYVSKLAPKEMRGRYMGIYGLTWATIDRNGAKLGNDGIQHGSRLVLDWKWRTRGAVCGGAVDS
jgi:dipeptide/tripeptide permease